MISIPETDWQQRLARNIAELMQELRVAQGGIQILFGFLLTVAFTDRYARAGALVQGLHLTAVLLAVAATALLTAPVAWHRALFRRGQREEIVRSANWMALGGLVCIAGAMTATLGLLVEVVVGGVWTAVVGTAAAVALCVVVVRDAASPALGATAVDIGIGPGGVAGPAPFAARYPPAQPACLRPGRPRSSVAPQLLTKPLRQYGRSLASDTVRQLLTQNRQRRASGAFGIGANT